MSARPPRLAHALLRLLLPSDEREEVLGDLTEQYAARRESGRTGAILWFAKQALTVPLWLWAGRLFGLRPQMLELRPVVRRLLRSPLFTGVAVLSMALGIGANTAIFSVLQSLLLTKIEADRPEELHFIYHARPESFGGVGQYSSGQATDPETGGTTFSNYSWPALQLIQSSEVPGVEIAGFSFSDIVSVGQPGEPPIGANSMMVTGDFFGLLRVPMTAGRPIGPEDDRPGAPSVAVLSHGLWSNVFGADPAIVGQAIRINGVPTEIIGVTGPGYEGLSAGGFFSRTDITLPTSSQPFIMPRVMRDDGSAFVDPTRLWLRAIARIEEGAVSSRALEMGSVSLQGHLIEQGIIESGDSERLRLVYLDASRGVEGVRDTVRQPLTILAWIVGLVLLIACANVGGLLVARGATRQREMAVRRAIGAPRFFLAWPLLFESLLVALLGAALGIGLAAAGGEFIGEALTAGLGATGVEFNLNLPLLAVTVAISIFAALASGLAPALLASRTSVRQEVNTRGQGNSNRTASVLITAQIALTLPLLVGAGLLTRSVAALDGADPGLRTEGLTVFEVDPATASTEPDEQIAVLDAAIRSVREVDGVASASIVSNLPLRGWTSNNGVTIEGERMMMLMNGVASDYFSALGIPLLAGRAIDERDGPDAPPVAVINQTASTRLFDGNPLGRFIEIGERSHEVVGVVADSRYQSVRADIEPVFYFPVLQRRTYGTTFVIETTRPTAEIERDLREAVSRAHPELPISDLRPYGVQVRMQTARERLFAQLLTGFGAITLLLACIGLYGVTAFSVSRRRAELGIRLALGARPHAVLGLVLRRVLFLATLGIAMGLGLTWFSGPLIEAFLYGLEPFDPWTLVGAGAALFTMASLAGWFPARRASRTDPLEVLGGE